MDNQQPSISMFELGWLCGIIDGEGCIGLWSRGGSRNSEFKPGVRIASTSPEIIETLSYLFSKLDVHA